MGVCKICLRIPQSCSLRGKRRGIKSLIARLKNRFNIAVAEIEVLDAHQTAVLAAVSVSNDARYLNGMLSRVVSFVDTSAPAELVSYKTEFFF